MIKVVCISACQIDRKTIYKEGIEYEIEKDFFNKNQEYFRKINSKKAE